MSFESNPKKLAVPDEAYYPVNRLYLFDRQNRQKWEEAFGEQAPKWDKSRRTKCWADTSVLKGVADPDNTYVEYDYFDTARRAFDKIRMTVREAATPNLMGEYRYPPYLVAPTDAVMVNPDGASQPINPRIICYKAEAEAVARELGGVAIQSMAFSSGHFVIHWNTEQRRDWFVRIGERYHNAALLVQARNKNGVGAPGEWKILDSGQPTWFSQKQETGDGDPRPEIPIPCRRLAANEALYLGHPITVYVYRTDMESEFNTSGTGGGTAVFPPELRAAIERIDANLQQLLALGVMSQQ